jgi:cytochrome c oxidase subunit 1
VTWLNQISTVGAYLLGFATLLFVVNYLKTLRGRPNAPADPWDGATLEWAIPSPPPPYNFAEIPTVHSYIPLWDEKYGSGHGPAERTTVVRDDRYAGLTAGQELALERAEPAHTAVAEHAPAAHGDHGHGIHMPNPSYYPFLAALGLVTVFTGLMITPAISVAGLALLLYGIYGWCFEPAG